MENNVRMLLARDGTIYIVDKSKDFHSNEGMINATELQKPVGSLIKTNKERQFYLLDPTFKDKYNRLKRDAQIILPKDLGAIVAQTGMGKESVVVDAGAGSGAAAIFFSQIAKKVFTCDINKKHLETVNENITKLQIKNVIVKELDIYTTAPTKNADIMNLDLPEPWNALNTAKKTLKVGGFLSCYTPHMTQVEELIKKIRESDDFMDMKVLEIIERDWKVGDRLARPIQMGLMHTAFLTFARRVK